MSALTDRIAGRRVVASISGGKDSAALSLWLTEQGIEHDRVFMDTGWEHELTYEYLRGPLTEKIGPITEIRGPLGMEELIAKKGMLPSRQRRFCTEELKVFPMKRHLAALMEAGVDCINAVGIRRAESTARSASLEWEWQQEWDCEIWRPLVEWTEQQVIDIHAKHALRPNPLYLQGATRVGCWPCIMARKGEIRLIADTDPARIGRLRKLEQITEVAGRERYERDRAAWIAEPQPEPTDPEKREMWAKKKKRLESPFVAPSWFQAPNARTGMMPIDKVVEWSRTSHGGKQFEIFAANTGDAGCMRWGLCDTGAKEEP